MKWVVFLATLMGVAPFGWWLGRHPRLVPLVWSVVGFLLFVQPGVPAFKLALIGELTPAYTQGIEVTLVDLLVLALRLTVRTRRISPPLRVVRAGYFLAVAASMAQAEQRMVALYAVWQLLRMNLVFAVVARACEDSRVPRAVLRGLEWGVLFTCLLGLVQRYVFHYHEIPATFGHENPVGMACNFGVMPALALLLDRRGTWLEAATPVAGTVAVILSLSRGGLLALVLGVGFLFTYSLNQLTVRKALIGFAAVLFGAVLLAKAYDQLMIRFTERSYGTFDTTTVDERAQLEAASAMMLEDHPYGVGANHFAPVLHSGGYFERAGIVDRGIQTEAIMVHNLYWLIATETGYPGLVTYALLLVTLLAKVFRSAWRARVRSEGSLLVGLGTSILLFHVHGLVEWIQVTMHMQYFFWISAAIAATVAQTVRETSGRVPRTAPGRARAGISQRARAGTRGHYRIALWGGNCRYDLATIASPDRPLSAINRTIASVPAT